MKIKIVETMVSYRTLYEEGEKKGVEETHTPTGRGWEIDVPTGAIMEVWKTIYGDVQELWYKVRSRI